MALTKSDKMDQAGVRTAADIEQKYNFGKSFAKAMGLAEDARTTAEEAKEAAQAASNLDYDKIFAQVTLNFQKEGVFTVDGHIFINGSRIKMEQADIDKLFANNIDMKGTFTHTVKTFIYPGKRELEILRQQFLLNVSMPYSPLFDFNDDGELDGIDLLICHKATMGIEETLEELSAWAKKHGYETDVTMTINLSNPDKAITFTGENIWGDKIDSYIGINFTNIKNPETEQKLSTLNGKFPSLHNSFGGANYETVVSNWYSLPNGTSWNCMLTGVSAPYGASAFGYRIDDYGAFIFLSYAGEAKAVFVGLDANGVLGVAGVRDI